MRLLPRSRRGTWLLAGAVWCAACAGLWGTLPVVQRTVRCPDDSAFIGYSPRFNLALAKRDLGNQRGAVYALDLLELDTGRRVAELFPRFESQEIVGTSADQRSWLIRLGDWESSHMYRVDLADRKITPLGKAQPPEAAWQNFSRDGRWAAIGYDPDLHVTRTRNGASSSTTGEHCNLFIWDVANDRLHRELQQCFSPYAFSADSRYVLAFQQPNRIAVFDCETGERRATILDGTLNILEAYSVAISDTGQFVAVMYRLWPGNNKELEFIIKCWSVADGVERIHDQFEAPQNGVSGVMKECKLRFAADGKRLAVLPNFDEPRDFRYYDTASGRDLSSQYPSDPHIWDLSPDGRTLIALRGVVNGEVVPGFARWFGLDDANYVHNQVLVFDATSGREVGAKRWLGGPALSSGIVFYDPEPVWSQDSSRLISQEQSHQEATLFQIPPRKSLMWFAAGAALLALPIALVAWRRTRKLRAA
jgi:hypothetical protein